MLLTFKQRCGWTSVLMNGMVINSEVILSHKRKRTTMLMLLLYIPKGHFALNGQRLGNVFGMSEPLGGGVLCRKMRLQPCRLAQCQVLMIQWYYGLMHFQGTIAAMWAMWFHWNCKNDQIHASTGDQKKGKGFHAKQWIIPCSKVTFMSTSGCFTLVMSFVRLRGEAGLCFCPLLIHLFRKLIFLWFSLWRMRLHDSGWPVESFQTLSL